MKNNGLLINFVMVFVVLLIFLPLEVALTTSLNSFFLYVMKGNLEIVEVLKNLYSGFDPSAPVDGVEVKAIPQAGSDRLYFRLVGGVKSVIGTFDPDPEEGRCFVNLSVGFKKAGRSVPSILAFSPDFRFYIQEDLGDVSLFSLLGDEGYESYVRSALKALVELQKTPAEVWEDACMFATLDLRQVMWDLNYFKYEYLKQRNVIFDENRLEDDFERLASRVISIPNEFTGFMMRDCQSRNVMMDHGSPVFIDYQGGRRGPSLYDAVSFLWQARAGFSDDFRMRMLDYYADEFCRDSKSEKNEMLASLPDVALFRMLQVLGAYGFRGLVQRRSHFLLSIPSALRNLKYMIESGWLDPYPELKRVAGFLVEEKSFSVSEDRDDKKLRVRISSFSYKKGYPVDMSGNGGGFCFDCRAMHNPGRYKEYKSLTGCDRPVVEFLEMRGEVQSFLRNVWGMTDAAVERYISRGFSNLQINFGCTGGQHRSVYCAEATARHIREMFPEAKVILSHREQPQLKRD